MERFLGPDDYSLVVIPPHVWNGMKGMSDVAIVANCADTSPRSVAHGTPRSVRRADPVRLGRPPFLTAHAGLDGGGGPDALPGVRAG